MVLQEAEYVVLSAIDRAIAGLSPEDLEEFWKTVGAYVDEKRND